MSSKDYSTPDVVSFKEEMVKYLNKIDAVMQTRNNVLAAEEKKTEDMGLEELSKFEEILKKEEKYVNVVSPRTKW